MEKHSQMYAFRFDWDYHRWTRKNSARLIHKEIHIEHVKAKPVEVRGGEKEISMQLKPKPFDWQDGVTPRHETSTHRVYERKKRKNREIEGEPYNKGQEVQKASMKTATKRLLYYSPHELPAIQQFGLSNSVRVYFSCMILGFLLFEFHCMWCHIQLSAGKPVQRAGFVTNHYHGSCFCTSTDTCALQHK